MEIPTKCLTSKIVDNFFWFAIGVVHCFALILLFMVGASYLNERVINKFLSTNDGIFWYNLSFVVYNALRTLSVKIKPQLYTAKMSTHNRNSQLVLSLVLFILFIEHNCVLVVCCCHKLVIVWWQICNAKSIPCSYLKCLLQYELLALFMAF